MKEAIGGISLFQIVILFVLLFTGIMCLTINESKAYAVKDEVITIIETGPAINTSEFSEEVATKLQAAGYRTTGKCPDKWIAYDRSGKPLTNKNNASFCIKVNDVAKGFEKDLESKYGKENVATNSYPQMVYYDVAFFYELDIPVVKYFMNFKIYGSTKVLFGDRS